MNSLREKIIKDFLKEYGYVPEVERVNYLYKEKYGSNASEENEKSMSGFINELMPIVGEESSSKNVTLINESVLSDLNKCEKNFKSQKELIEKNYNLNLQKINRLISETKRLERNVNRELLLKGKGDMFVYGVTESFENYDKVNFETSFISMNDETVTVKNKQVSISEFKEKEISYSIFSKSGFGIGSNVKDNITNVLKEDGRFFNVIYKSKIQNDNVNLIVELNFEELKKIEVLRFVIEAIETNSKMKSSCFITKDRSKYYPVYENDKRVKENVNLISIREEIKGIKLILSKSAADIKYNENEYGYVFSLDYLGEVKSTFKTNEEFVLNLGPYKILNENKEDVFFTMATVKHGTCVVAPEKTSVDIYLSNDNINWINSNYNKEGKQIIYFEENNGNSLFSVVDNENSSSFIANVDFLNKRLKGNERFLNLYFKKDDWDKVIKSSISIKRNLLKTKKDLYENQMSGWEFDQEYYSCIIEINQPEGRYFDFGNRKCYVNEREVEGKIFIPYGEHSFKTSKENWNYLDVEEKKVLTESQLKKVDKLYPFNHKYVIEGYKYNSNFNGKKRYYGADEVYGEKLKEVSNQRFRQETKSNVYTFIEIENDVYIKIKNVDSIGESNKTLFDINCRKENTSESRSSDLYVKAVLKTFDENVAPKIEQIQVRVI